jgi:hypothetical protein
VLTLSGAMISSPFHQRNNHMRLSKLAVVTSGMERAYDTYPAFFGKGRRVVADEQFAAATVIGIVPIITIPISIKIPTACVGWDWELNATCSPRCNEENDYDPNCYYIVNDRDMVSTLVSLR